MNDVISLPRDIRQKLKMKLCSLLLGTVVANYNTYTIPIDSDLEFTWSSSDNFMEYISMEGDKEFVKYQVWLQKIKY